MTEHKIARRILEASFKVPAKPGSGVYESVPATQLLTMLRLTGLKLGLLIDFGAHLKTGIKRIVTGDLGATLKRLRDRCEPLCP